MSAYYKKKYKPWRKGKSTKHNGGDTTGGITSAKSHGSLKQQLRGLQRLQQKKMKDRTSIEGTLADEQQLQQQEQELQEKIDALQEQIQMRTISEKERVNAKKSHKLRFVDRQRTTRLYQQYIKQLQQLEEQLHQITSTDSNETTVDMQRQQRNKINDDLYRLALDQIYIAHFPLDRTSYVSLFNPTNHNHAVISSTSSSNATQMPTQQQQRRTVMNNRLLHKMATQRQCIIERLNKTHQIINETKHQNQIIEEEDDDTHHEANQRTNNNNTIPSDKTICSSTTKRIQPVLWIHPSQYERIQHLSTWSTQLERTTFQITIVNDNSTSDTGKSKSSNDDDDDDMVQSSSEVDTTTDNRTDERFHNVTATFNTTQQLLLQEQERMERELSTLEDDEEENKDDEVAEQSQLITTKGTKHRTANTTRVASTYDNDDSDASGDSSNSNDDEMDDDDDDNNVDPLQRSVGAVVAKVSRENDEITGDIEDEDDDSDSSSSEQSSDSVSISSQPDNTYNTINYNDTENSQMATSQDEVIAMATNLRKLASQKGKVSTNNNHKSVEMEEEDDFFVSLDDDNDKDHELHPTSKNVNVFANAKRDTIRYNHSHNGTGDKSQGWVTQKQLPGQFRKKQRR